ncbi:MAG: TolC family protein [Gemmatimonadetes bacterium]|nr:TolC family protein [Gemmatimonadota bacterium]
MKPPRRLRLLLIGSDAAITARLRAVLEQSDMKLLRSAVLALAAAAILAAPVAAQKSPGLTLGEVYSLAAARNARLQAARAVTRAKEALEASAALPPDPMLQVGIMNFSVPGLETDMPTSMAPAIQAMQMIPFPGKLSLSGRIAEQSSAIARAEADEAWWEVRAEAAMAFYMIYEADRQIEVMRETLGLLQDFEQVAKAMYSAGVGRQSDVLRAGVEVARMEADLRRMEAMRKAAAARLNGILNRPADTPIPEPVFSPLPLSLPGADTLRAWAEATRPMLAKGRTGVQQAEARSALARKEIWPDPVVGVQYGQRAGDMGTGTERMGSLMLGFNLPIFAPKRQLRMRAEAAAMEQMAWADLTEMRARVDARIGELLAGLERTRTLVRLYRTEVLPPARANVESSFASYRVGAVDFMTLVDAQMTVNQYQQEYYGLLAEYGRAVAELEMSIGRELPRTDELIAEAT